MSLLVDIVHRQGVFTLTADFEVTGGLTALFGPSGSGKTTLINLIAGLTRPERGRIALDGTVWADAEARIFLPAHRRRIGYVFQEGRLFPHMTVEQNLTFGRRFAPRSARRESLSRVVDMLGIGALLKRQPAALSGGEKQRVAFGRALLCDPRLLLMDEPLSALDGDRKAAILPYIERIRDEVGIPILYVSHSVEEVARLATRIIALSHGRCLPLAAPGEILNLMPSIEGVSRAGSFLHARIIEQWPDERLTVAHWAGGRLYLRHEPLAVGSAVRVFVPAAEIVVARGPIEHVSTLNRVPGVVASLERTANGMIAEIACADEKLTAELTRRSADALCLVPGVEVTLLFKAIAMGPQSLYRGPA